MWFFEKGKRDHSMHDLKQPERLRTGDSEVEIVQELMKDFYLDHLSLCCYQVEGGMFFDICGGPESWSEVMLR